MQFDDVIKNRKSVRSFKHKNVPWRKVLDAIDSARLGPFADGLNHMKFLIIEEPETIKKLAASADQSWIEEAQSLIVVCSDDSNLEAMHGERGRVYSRQQSGAAINTIMLKLTDLGIDSCWVGSFSDESIKQSLGIPGHIQIEALIPMGYDSGKSKKKKKKDLENVLFWESWDTRKRPTMLKEDVDKYGFR
ncbi:MAG: nitroreductase family protein [archaeon]